MCVCVLGVGGAGEEEQDIREQCLTLRGQLLSQLARYRRVCFRVGCFISCVAVVVLCCLFVPEFCCSLPLAPLVCHLRPVNVSAAQRKWHFGVFLQCQRVNINTELDGKSQCDNLNHVA